MNEDEVTRLLSRAAASIPPMSHQQASQLIRGGQRMQRRRRLLGAGGVATVTALIIGAGALWLPGTNGQTPVAGDETAKAPDNTASPATDETAQPTAPDGTRWVGFNGVMVAVPSTWSVNHTRCGQPLSDTVDFEDEGYEDCAIDGAFTVVRVMALSSPTGQQWEGVDGKAVDVNGTPGTRVGADGCRLSNPPQCSGLLAIPDMDAVFVVESRRSAEEVNAILDTARRVPEGYTAVPDVEGVVNDFDVAPLMDEAELQWSPRCTGADYCDMLAITGTNPRAGNIVPVGTTVTSVESTPGEDADALAGQFGPLTIFKGGSGDEARLEGEIEITAKCVFLETPGSEILLTWPEGSVAWAESGEGVITFTDPWSAQVTAIEDGHHVVLGGGGSLGDEGVETDWSAWVDSRTWVAEPDPACERPEVWGVSGLVGVED